MGRSREPQFSRPDPRSPVTAPLNSDSGARPQTTYSSYDGVGRPQTILDPNGKSTSYTYDPLGRVLTVTLPPVSGNVFTTTYSYDHFDAGTQLVFTYVTDPNGKLTKLGYDEQGRLRKSVDAASGETNYAYTNDVLTSITDPNGNVTSYQYDALKRLSKTIFPDGNVETYSYYADGLLQSKTDRKGQTITYQYDGFKRLTRKIYPDSTAITYTYTGQKLVTVLDETKSPSETHTFTYDGSYRVASSTQGLRGTLSYTYTPDDRVATMAVQAGPTQTYSYYPDGSLNTASWSVVSGNFKYTYTPTGQYQEISFPNGQKRDYSYDDQGRLLTLSNTLGATNLASFAYAYDHDWTSGTDTMLGQRTSMTATVPAQGLTAAESRYTYDPLYQLVKAQYPAGTVFNGETHEWAYDALGNRISSKVNGTGPSYTYLKNGTNPLNGQRLSSDGVNIYTYDPNGSQTARTGSANYGFGYDVDNRLSSISGAETAAYTYDYQGRRTSKTEAGVTTTYLYDGLNPIAETVASTPKYALNGPSIDEPLAVSASGTISYLNADGLGSILSTNNPAGTVAHSLSFDAWGVPRNESGSRTHGFTYTGREAGVAGMHFYRARFLQPGVGRFLQEDPVGAQSSDYAYVDNTPTGFIDPHGLKRAKKQPQPRSPNPGPRSDFSIVVCKKERRLELHDSKTQEPLLNASIVCGCEGPKEGTPTPEGHFTAGAWQQDKTNPKFSGPQGWNKDPWGNPYGPWFLPINGSGGCGIHGTRGWSWLGDTFIDMPFTCSHGCIRMSNDNIEQLHNLLTNPSGTKVWIRNSCDE